jgi:hypothetical protein
VLFVYLSNKLLVEELLADYDDDALEVSINLLARAVIDYVVCWISNLNVLDT